jgi:HK97 family phage prohead protease
MSNEREQRINTSKISIRAKADGKKYVEGYAATYGTRSTPVQGSFIENLCRGCARCQGAFSRAIREKQDVRLLFNHNADSLPLARTKSGTLTLTQDSIGLRFSALLPDSQFAKDLAASLQRKDLDSCSFAFVKRDDSWTDDVDAEGNAMPLRTIHDLDLFDVSIVNFPQYPGTSVSANAITGLMDQASLKVSPRALAEARSRAGSAPKTTAPVILMDEQDKNQVRRERFRKLNERIRASDDAADGDDEDDTTSEFNGQTTQKELCNRCGRSGVKCVGPNEFYCAACGSADPYKKRGN